MNKPNISNNKLINWRFTFCCIDLVSQKKSAVSVFNFLYI